MSLKYEPAWEPLHNSERHTPKQPGFAALAVTALGCAGALIYKLQVCTLDPHPV